MTTPPQPDPGTAFLEADAEDRRHALTIATQLTISAGMRPPWQPQPNNADWLATGDRAYLWLRQRRSLIPASIVLIPGTPFSEENPVTTSMNLQDNDQVGFTIGGTDAKGASTAAPADTWAWTLTDPDQSGAVLTVSTDTTNATVAAGTPTANLSLSVAGQNTGLQGAEAIIVTAGPAAAIALVPGTPSAES